MFVPESFRNVRRPLGVLSLALSLIPAGRVQANEETFATVAPSTAQISTGRGYGTGWVVDAEQRLLVTARHVVEAGPGVVDTVEVVFPVSKDGEMIQDADY